MQTDHGQEGSRKRRRTSPDHDSRTTTSRAGISNMDSSSNGISQIPTDKPIQPTPLPAAIQPDLETMRQLLTCKVCHRFMHEPYSLACGHTYCYSCLTNWIAENHKKTCPDCRAAILTQPSPSYVIREMVSVFVNNHHLLADGEDPAEHIKIAAEEQEVLGKDRADENVGMFRGCFRAGRGMPFAALHDPTDGVDRCPNCHWEIEDGYCNMCGVPVGEGLSDFEDLITDEDEDEDEDENDAQDLARHRDYLDFDLDHDDVDGGYPWPDGEFAVREMLFGVEGRRIRNRMRRLRRRVARQNPNMGSEPDTSVDEEDEGSMDGFIAGDDEEIEVDLDQDDGSESEDDGDGDGIRRFNRSTRPSRRRGVPIVLSDDDDIDVDDSDSDDDDDGQSEISSSTSGGERRLKTRTRTTTRSRPVVLSDDENSLSSPVQGSFRASGAVSSDTDSGDEDDSDSDESRSQVSQGFSPIDDRQDSVNGHPSSSDADQPTQYFDAYDQSDDGYDDNGSVFVINIESCHDIQKTDVERCRYSE